MFGEHANIRTFEHLNISEHPNIRTSEHLDIDEHSNIEHLNVQKLANIVEHSNTNLRRFVAPDCN